MKKLFFSLMALGIGLYAYSAATVTSVYSTGFESAPTGTNYQSTVTVASDKADGASWTIYYGCVSTSSKISGNNSAHMRLYSDKKMGYLRQTSNIENVDSVCFKYAVSNKNVKFDVKYSTDEGSTWTKLASISPSGTSATTLAYRLPARAAKFRLSIEVTGGHPTKSNYTFRIDDIAYFKITEESSDKYYLAGSMTDWATNKIELTGSPLSTTVALAANTSYTFKMMKNSDTWYGNSGAIITNISGWGFSSSDANNCRLYTGPAGDYTFTFDPTTGNVSVTYPTVSHPAVGYSYFKKYGSDTSIKAYIYTSDGDRVSDWEGSPAVTATTTICGDTYFYFALQGCGKNNVIIRYNNASSQTAAMSATSASQKWAESSSSAFSVFSTYTVSCAPNTSGYGTVSQASVTNVACGTSISASGATLTVGTTNVTATAASQTAQYTYGFTNWTWTESLSSVTKDITATANFTRTTRSYTINALSLTGCTVTGTAWPTGKKDYGSSFSTTISASEGYQLPSSISVTGADYTWNQSTGALAITSVKGDVSVTITATKKTYTVTFYNVGELKKTVSNVEHGTLFSAIKPTVGTGSGQLDIKSCDATSTTFMGWTSDASFQKRSNAPSFITDDTAITGDLELRAVWARAE